MTVKPLRIEVVGSHSVGKSVLVRHIAKAYGLPILDEIARIGSPRWVAASTSCAPISTQ